MNPEGMPDLAVPGRGTDAGPVLTDTPCYARTQAWEKKHKDPTGLKEYTTHILVIPMKWKDWVHVTKLDPDKQLKPGDIDAIAASGTDALMLSGTLNVTRENLAVLLKQVRIYNLPLVMEPAGPEAVLLQGIDYVFVNGVLVVERERHTGALPGKVLRRKVVIE